MSSQNNQELFLALIRAGLWETVARLSLTEEVDWEEVYRLASEQSVLGLVLTGIEHSNVKPPQELLLQWIGEVQILEQQNKSMNQFIAELIEKLRNADIYTLLVKGQGIAQCYERPLWRACGDVDLFLSESNYEKAKVLLKPLALNIDEERPATKHIAMSIRETFGTSEQGRADSWEVELHGTLRSELWGAVDDVLDEIKEEVFYRGAASSWMNNQTQIFILGPNENVAYVFTHILQHFFRGGIGLRQICDWCRLLWTYKELLDYELLESRIRKMGVMNEWKAFAALAVNSLGMPIEAMPLFNENDKQNLNLHKKARRIMEFLLETGNFGHNRDISYQSEYPAFTRKLITFMRQAKDSWQIMRIFPLDALKSLYSFWKSGIKAAVNGK